MATLPMLGQMLTLYRQGSKLGLAVGIATAVLFNLPWHLLPEGGQLLQLLLAVGGGYAAATLAASRAPSGTRAEQAASRWL